MFNPRNSLVCSCITPYSDLIRLALYFKKISLSALSGSSRARCSVMTPPPPAVLKRRSEVWRHKKDWVLSGWDIRYLIPFWPEPEPEPDSKKWPDIRPTGTGYPVHPYTGFRLGLFGGHSASRRPVAKPEVPG